MTFSLSRDRNAQETLLAQARIEHGALGFISSMTAAKLAAQGFDVPALEDRFEMGVR